MNREPLDWYESPAARIIVALGLILLVALTVMFVAAAWDWMQWAMQLMAASSVKAAAGGLAVSLRSDVHADAPQDVQSVSDAEFAFTLNRQLQLFNGADLADEVLDAFGPISEAISRNDPALLGKMLLAIRLAHCERCAARECCINMRTQNAEQAARAVLESASELHPVAPAVQLSDAAGQGRSQA